LFLRKNEEKELFRYIFSASKKRKKNAFEGRDENRALLNYKAEVSCLFFGSFKSIKQNYFLKNADLLSSNFIF
jgi:hypothetical protein